MNYYRLGLAINSASVKPTRYQQGSEIQVGILPGYISVGEVLDEMKLLTGEIRSYGKELFDATGDRNLDDPLTNWYVKRWTSFATRWDNFYSENQGFWDRFVSTDRIYNLTQQFRKEMIEMREIAEEKGMRWGSADPRSPLAAPGGLTGSLSKTASSLLWTILKFSLIGGVVFLAFMYLSKKIGS